MTSSIPEAADARPRGGGRIASLDGLRAISIALVLLGHLKGTAGFPDAIGDLAESRVVDVANLGVRVFFVISGFLITGLLLAEWRKTGRVSLPHFYLRRTFRIFPAYFALLGVVALLAAAGVVRLLPGDWLHALTYTMNYHDPRSWYVGHLWSLSVEEQFYLLWPAVVLLLGPVRAMWCAAGFVAVAPAIRLASWQLLPESHELIGNTFGTVGDAIAVGCVLAGAREWLWRRERYRALLMSRWFVPLLLALALALNYFYRLSLAVGITTLNVALALTIERCVRAERGIVGRALNARPLVFFGQLSYSVYLWQQLFLNRNVHSPVTSFPLNLILALAAATVSYYAVERPMLEARAGVERRWWTRRA
jgi:peptidoglycan/LPS O-acetylase OafA/YrhL